MASRIQAYTCPCCKGFIGEAAPLDEIIAAEGPFVSKTILEMLAKNVGRGVRRDDLIVAIYRGAKEPEKAGDVVRQTICRLRKRLDAYGWCILTVPSSGASGEGGALYRLTPTIRSA